MKKILVSLLLLVFLLPGAHPERKKVALVLSGGGAKGIAHVGAIKVLEEAGIPVDYVVGTSMGAIVGGLYAIGYNAESLDSIVRRQDWNFLLGDRVNRNDLSFSEKESTEKYVFSLPFGQGRTTRMPAGFVNGQNIYNLFSDLTIGYHDSLDFSKLPVPFACIAANIVNGREIVLKEGNLVQAMRASMAIPGFFTPVRIDSLVLVDGGIVNNFPVDVAKAMGADIIIGVDVQGDLKDAENLKGMRGVVGQLINLLCMNKYEDNLKMTDIRIRPEVEEYSAASFNADAIDVMIRRGEVAARMQLGQLKTLKKQLEGEEVVSRADKSAVKDTFYVNKIYLRGIPAEEESWLHRVIRLKENSFMTLDELHRAIASLYGTKAFTEVTYRLTGGPVYNLELTLTESRMNVLNLGFRFDTEEMAAILLNTRFNLKALVGSKLALTARLSKNPYVRLDYSFENPFLRKLNLAYMFRYNDFNLYMEGDKTNGITYRYHLGEASLTDLYLRNFKFQIGLRYEYFDYDKFLYKDDNYAIDVKSEGFVSYYVLAQLETYDQRYFPRKGLSFGASYSLYTDNFAQYDGHAPFSALQANFTGIIPVTNRFKVIPSVYGRVLIGHDVPYPYLNYMGGDMAGRYMQQQLPFLGINHIEVFQSSLLVAKLQLRQRMGSKHYAWLAANYALQDNNFFDILGDRGIWGGGVGYSYVTPIGPVDVVISLSDWTHKTGFYFNLGYYF